MNQVTLIGIVSQEPKITTTPSGATVARFSVAVPAKKKDGSKYDEYFSVETWSKSTIEVLKQGQEVAVVGKLKTDSWVDSKTNEKKYITKVSAFSVFFAVDALTPISSETTELALDEDLPF